MPIDQQILQRLQANDEAFTKLTLSFHRLTATDMQALVQALQGNTSLNSLDVYVNRIGYEGAKVLALNRTLTSLVVSCNQIGKKGAKSLGLNQTLTSLDVDYNQITGRAVKGIRSMLQRNRRRAVTQRNEFILHWLKWSKTNLLPLELIAHIISYVDSVTFLSMANLRHFAYIGKSQEQAYQCALFILNNSNALKNQIALSTSGDPFIIERKPKTGEKLVSERHFYLFKTPAANPPRDVIASLDNKSLGKRQRCKHTVKRILVNACKIS